MNVLQIIDSLDAGGAEQIAVLLANEMLAHDINSHICITRKEGLLKEKISDDVGYLFLHKKKTIDFKALKKVRNYVKQHQIEIIHAHSTSFFMATLVKIWMPNVKLVWHTHLGARAIKKQTSNKFIKLCSYFFDAIIAVNEPLVKWCDENLNSKNNNFIPNGVQTTENTYSSKKRDKTIVCVANLKAPKNHHLLIKAFAEVVKKHQDWKLTLVGKTFQDEYENEVRTLILKNNLTDKVVFTGAISNVLETISKGSIGVLPSNNEGLSVALLEYGAASLAVIATDVGQSKKVVQNNGIIIPAGDVDKCIDALLLYIQDEIVREEKAKQFHLHVINTYSIEKMVVSLKSIYVNL